MKSVNRSKLVRSIIIMLILMMFAVSAAGCGSQTADTAAAENEDSTESSAQSVKYIYGIPMDEDAAVVVENVADVYEKPDVSSARITQVLCNQPVHIDSEEGGWSKVKTVSGLTGWIKTKFISDDISSLTGRVFTYRIIVTSREKTVYSGPDGGITMLNAYMGTEFYAFNNISDAYEVFLPGNRTGWLKGSGIIRIPVDDAIPVTNADDFASTALKFKGMSFMLNGMSALGIDAPNLVYICARINGVNVPITLEGQLNTGIQIDIDEVRAGDLVFLSRNSGSEYSGDSEDSQDNQDREITSVGICIGGGNYIYAGRKTGYVAIGDIYRENADGIVAEARRIFN